MYVSKKQARLNFGTTFLTAILLTFGGSAKFIGCSSSPINDKNVPVFLIVYVLFTWIACDSISGKALRGDYLTEHARGKTPTKIFLIRNTRGRILL